MRCNADNLDEQWSYDHERYIKTLIGLAFICRGCHWLKSPGFRIRTWLGLTPPTRSRPHIETCLGWPPERVERLRQHDLNGLLANRHAVQSTRQEIQRGTAVALPSPIERLPSADLERMARPGQIVVVPWRVDLTYLAVYGYSTEEIKQFEQRMYVIAANRMDSLNRDPANRSKPASPGESASEVSAAPRREGA
jgi:hypothetical protein